VGKDSVECNKSNQNKIPFYLTNNAVLRKYLKKVRDKK
jgi:hypothetical protein